MTKDYLPFFRKYRPQSFKDIIGQESLVKTLTSAIKLNRIAHAYLFCGPRGTGKTSSARILAKSLNCIEGPTLTPCQKCPSCVDITNATGVDVIEIDAATNRGIDDAKNLIEQTQYAPMNGRYKIFIIDEVHMLTTPAFNALLKTLEEPPQNVIFILATTEPQNILETIVSRCQRFDFKRITTADIVKKLREVSDLEKIKISDDALFAIAKNVSGGLRDSLALLDKVSILGFKEEISKETIENMLGKLTFDVLFNLAENLAKADLAKAMEILENIYANGNEPRNFVENLMEFLKNVIIVLNSSESSNLDFVNLNSFETEKIRKSALDKNLLVKFIDKIIEFYKEIKNSTNPYLVTELLLVDLCNMNSNDTVVVTQKPAKDAISKETITKEISISPQKVEHKPTKNEAAVEKTKESVDSENTGNNGDVWMHIINSIESIPAKCFFSDVAKLIEINDNSVVLGFLHLNAIAQAKSDLKSKPLKAALQKVFEKEHNVKYIQITKDTPVIEAKVKNTQKQTQKPVIKEEIKEDLYPTDNKMPEPQVEETRDIQIYSAKTKEMVESFSGKVID